MRRARVFVLAVVAAVSLAATLSVGADELPPPPGWSQEIWDTLSPEDQEIERDMSPPPVDDVEAVIAETEAWIESHPVDEFLDELARELEAEGEFFNTIHLGLQEPNQVFGKMIWSFDKVWVA